MAPFPSVFFKVLVFHLIIWFRTLQLIMSVSQIFTIVGDGNVRRNMTALNIASRASMKSAQIVDHVGGTLEQALQVVKPEANVCIIASITDVLISGGDCGTIFSTLDPVLASLHAQITSFCISRPSLQVPKWFLWVLVTLTSSCYSN